MPIRPRPIPLGPCVALAAVLLLGACSASAAGPSADPVPRAPARTVDPVGANRPEPDPVAEVAGAHEIALVADFGPLPDGSGRAVVETTWTRDATGTIRFAIVTPAGLAEQHVLTDAEHWWWLSPEVRGTIADAEWIRFDLAAVEEVGGELPDIVVEARRPPPQPHEIAVGDVVAGREVLAVEVVGDDEVHLTVAGVERPVIHVRRPLALGTTIDLPTGAVDVADLPGVLRW